MKRFSGILLAFFLSSPQLFGQIMPNFDIFTLSSRFGPTARDYFRNNNFVIEGIQVMTEGTILVNSTDRRTYDPEKIRSFLVKYYPDPQNAGMVIIDWESGPHHDLKNYPVTDSRFKDAESTFISLIALIKTHRPNLRVGVYSLPYRHWNDWQKNTWNVPGKYEKVLAKTDFIVPSVYSMKTEEEFGWDRISQYLKSNLDDAFVYAKKLNKPVYPFVWHRIHRSNTPYPYEIMQKEAMAKIINYIATYSFEGHKASGVYWWDDVSGRLDKLEGIHGHLKGTVYDAATYDAMIIGFGKYFKQVLGKGYVPNNIVPVANAGSNKSVILPANSTTLTGSGTDADGFISNFAWSQVSGPRKATFSNPRVSHPMVSNLYEGTYVFSLTVTDGRSAVSTPSEVTVSVGKSGANQIPVANAGAARSFTLPENSLVLSGSGSDADGTISSYFWNQLSGPNTATFSSATVAKPTVSNLTEGSYVFSLVVKDNQGASSSASKVTVTVYSTTDQNPASGQQVVSYTLVNADNNQDLMPITEGSRINLASLPTRNLNVRANTYPSTVGSVVLRLTGQQSRSQTETAAPYALFSDDKGNYHAWTPPLGSYSLTATPYTESGGSGTAGASLTVDFTFVEVDEPKAPLGQQVVSYTLVNADNNQDLMPITEGSRINLASLPTRNLNVRANTYPATVGSVVLRLTGQQSRSQTETAVPYALFSDAKGNYYAWTPPLGSYSLTATPYTEYGGNGTAGTSLTVAFTVISDLTISTSTTSSKSTALSDEEMGNIHLEGEVALYPNPASTTLHIKMSQAGEGDTNVQLLDRTGRLVLSQVVKNEAKALGAKLDVGKLTRGTYVLVVIAPNGRFAKRVLIE